MKKFFGILLASTLVLGACGHAEKTEKESADKRNEKKEIKDKHRDKDVDKQLDGKKSDKKNK